MPITPEEAVARVREAMGVNAIVPGQTWCVRRLDRDDDNYFLVVLGPPTASVAVAAVAVRDGEVTHSARLSGQRPQVSVDQEHALRQVGSAPDLHAEMVWRPCRASFSPLDPLWEIRSHGNVVYVDQRGAVHPSLEPGGPGG